MQSRRGLRVWQEFEGMVHGSAAKGEPGMFATLIKLFKNEDGATAIEYGLIAALIAVAAVTVLGTVGTNLTATFQTVANKL
jgi:pilus assembly protein Flp/PilA